MDTPDMQRKFLDEVVDKRKHGFAIEDPEKFTSQMLERLCKHNRKDSSASSNFKKIQKNNRSVPDYDHDGY